MEEGEAIGVLIDGQPASRIAAEDRGLLYGDGLFETLAVEGGRPLCWARHIRRLRQGARRLALPWQVELASLLKREALALCRERERAVLKIVLTRGVGKRGYRPPVPAVPTRILILGPASVPDDGRRHGVTLRFCATRLAEQPRLAGIKHLNRLEQVLARQEWDDTNVAEGLMLDTRGRVVSGTMSNLFLVRANGLHTPALHRCGVAGVMRAQVLEIARRLRLQPRQTDLTPEDVLAAEELFLTNSLIGLWPVCRLEDRRFCPGPVAARIFDELCATRTIPG